jgi:hypothetical protein
MLEDFTIVESKAYKWQYKVILLLTFPPQHQKKAKLHLR